jgi:hypothetical protein
MNELQTTESELMLADDDNANIDRLFKGDAYDRCLQIGELMAKGKLTTPAHLRGSVADCFAVATQAMLWRMNPFAVAQKTHIVNGAMGYESQLIIAVINNSGLLATRLDFKWEGPWGGLIQKPGKEREAGCKVYAWATLKGETEPRVLELEMAQASVRNSPLWATDPRQQLAYLAGKRWARLHAPDAILGVYSPDELAEIRQPEKDITPRNATPAQIGQAAARVDTGSEENEALRGKLIKDLEETAKVDGPAGLGVHWKEVLTKDQRTLVGAEELNRIKGVAEDAVKAAKATQADAVDPAFVSDMEQNGG